MIRVLHVLGGLDVGGAESMVMNIYRMIDKSKIQFDFIVHTTEHQFYYNEVTNLGGRIFAFPRFTGFNLHLIKKQWVSFLKKHKEYKIIHSHIRSYASIFLPIAKKNGLVTIIHSHSTSNGKGISSLIKRIMQYPLRHQADYFMGCSKEAGKWLFGNKVVNGDRYFMVKNAIDTTKYKFSISTRNEYRQMLGISCDCFAFIHVGRFHPAKNHKFLIDLFHEYHSLNQNSKLILVGDGELKEQIVNQIEHLKLKDSVILTGFRNDAYNILQAADCFLFPSNWEGLPLTVVEAQASGLYCLVSNHITHDVSLSKLVKYLPIDRGVRPWIDCINGLSFHRIDVSNEITKKGFDIKESTKWFEGFYTGIYYG